MRKYFLLLNTDHGPNVKVCLKTLCKIQIHMVINGKIVIPKVLHNINLIGIMLGKTICNNPNGLRIPNHPSLTNRITNGRTSITTSKTNRTNENHTKGIGSLQTNGGDLNSGLTKIPILHNYHLQLNNLL